MSGFLFFRDNLSHSVVYAYTVVVQLQSTTKKIYVSRQKWLKKVERDVLLERHTVGKIAYKFEAILCISKVVARP